MLHLLIGLNICQPKGKNSNRFFIENFVLNDVSLELRNRFFSALDANFQLFSLIYSKVVKFKPRLCEPTHRWRRSSAWDPSVSEKKKSFNKHFRSWRNENRARSGYSMGFMESFPHLIVAAALAIHFFFGLMLWEMWNSNFLLLFRGKFKKTEGGCCCPWEKKKDGERLDWKNDFVNGVALLLFRNHLSGTTAERPCGFQLTWKAIQPLKDFEEDESDWESGHFRWFIVGGCENPSQFIPPFSFSSNSNWTVASFRRLLLFSLWELNQRARPAM